MVSSTRVGRPLCASHLRPEPPQRPRGRRAGARLARACAGRPCAAALIVPIPQPFSFELTTERFRAFGRDPANLWEDGRLYRVVAGQRGRHRPRGREACASIPTTVSSPRRFSVSSAPASTSTGFARLATTDPVLARLAVDLRGLRPSLVPDPFEALVTSITAQQVSLHAAFAIRDAVHRALRRRGTAARGLPHPRTRRRRAARRSSSRWASRRGRPSTRPPSPGRRSTSMRLPCSRTTR